MQDKRSSDLYSSITSRKVLFIFVCVIILLLLIPIAVSLGPASIGISEVAKAIASHLPFLDFEVSDIADIAVNDLRGPRVIMAVVSGAAFALAGATMQGVIRNPLVSPFTLGISSAAGFGAALGIVLGNGFLGSALSQDASIVVNAFILAMLATALVFALSSTRKITPVTVILAGIAVSYFFSACTSIMKYISDDEQLRHITVWLFGDLSGTNWNQVLVVAIIFAFCLPVLMKYAWDLNTMAAGDEAATSLGTPVKRVRIICMIFSTVVTAAAVSFNGVIGFVCLVAPHITRMMVGADHRFLMPASCLLGAILLLVSDTFSRMIIQPTEIPVGIVTAFVGVPFFVYLLMTKRKEYF